MVKIASRFIQQFKEPYSASRSLVAIIGVHIPEKLYKNIKIHIKKSK